jgi:16S rRNA (guanine527-N7)-methyltransferase
MEKYVEMLRAGAKELGLDIDREKAGEFLHYMEMLIHWNKKINLTAITHRDGIVTKHFLDSLTCAATGLVDSSLKAVDIGTGAGFPGIPLKIVYPGLEMTLIDSLRKRVQFMERVVLELGLSGISVLHGRAEDAARSDIHRERYDLCLSRAIAHLSVAGEYCLPFVKTGGSFIAMKGPGYLDEIREAGRAIGLLGGEITDTMKFKIPFTDITHYIIIIRKTKSTGAEYPRKAGRPAKYPLR